MIDKDKLTIMSLSVKPEMQNLLKVSSKKSGKSVSSIVRELVEKYLPLIVNEGEEIPVVLRIPSELKGDEENLRNWINSKTEVIISKLKNVESN